MAVVQRAERFSPIEIKEILYQDPLSAAFFNADTKDVQMAVDEDAVKQSILNILLTNRGERLFNNTFGSDINALLFENATPQTSAALLELIKGTIENFEPRAELLDVIVSPLPDNNAYSVTIIFGIINKTEPITLEFLLNRVR